MKKLVTLLASMALVAGALSIAPASAAEEAPELPAEPNITDPAEDANFGALPVTFNGADILAGWFTHDDETISAHVQTLNDARAESVLIDVGFDPGVGAACMYIDAVTAGNFNDARVELYYEDDCGDQGAVPVEGGTYTVTEGPDGTAIHTITVPRAADPAFADGKTLGTPYINIWNNATDQTGAVGTYDTTDPGTDYVIEGGEPAKTPPGKNNPPGKKLGCKKGKGKKRGCESKGKKSPKPGKPSASCAPFTPGEAGAEKPTVVVTDAATEAAPVEQKVTVDPSAADAAPVTEAYAVVPPSHDAFNIQVDSAATEAGLYALVEFEERNDIDMSLLHPDGSYAAQSRGFNTLAELVNVEFPAVGPIFTSGHGGESTTSSEKLVGIRTSDCGGWTLDVANYLGMGGELTVKLWLGEAVTDPLEEGAES